MRVSKIGAAAVLGGVLLVAGCSGGAPADEETTSAGQDAGDAQGDDDAAAADDADDAGGSDCPALAVGDAVDVTVLATCTAEATRAVSGYAASTDMGGAVSEVRVNNDPQAMQMTSDMGEVIVVDGVTYVRSTGDWQEGDTSSSDPVIAGLSAAGESLDTLDPAAQAGALTGLELTVTGTDTRLGQDVFVISGEGEIEGSAVTAVMYVGADYAVLGSEGSTEVMGTTIDTVLTVTAWDEPQEITAPM